MALIIINGSIITISTLYDPKGGTLYLLNETADIASTDPLYPITPEYDEWIHKNASGYFEDFKR